MGLWGNILVKSHILKSKFDVFDIRKDYSPNVQNMRKIYLLGFSIQRLWEKSLKISRSFSVGPLFSKYDWWVPKTQGFIGSNIFFLAVMHLFNIAYLSKCLNGMEDACKMLNDRP